MKVPSKQTTKCHNKTQSVKDFISIFTQSLLFPIFAPLGGAINTV